MKRALALTAVLLACSDARGADTPPLPPIDAPAIAKRVVASLHPAPGEGAVLVADPTYYPELARAMELELDRAGVRPVLNLGFPAADVVRSAYGDPARARQLEDAWVRALQPLFDGSALFFWLPARVLPPGHTFERLVDASRVRGVHFHWILPVEGRNAEELRAMTN